MMHQNKEEDTKWYKSWKCWTIVIGIVLLLGLLIWLIFFKVWNHPDSEPNDSEGGSDTNEGVSDSERKTGITLILGLLISLILFFKVWVYSGSETNEGLPSIFLLLGLLVSLICFKVWIQPDSEGPHQGGSGPHQAGSGPHQGGSGPHQGGSGPHQGGSGPHQGGSETNDGTDLEKKIAKECLRLTNEYRAGQGKPPVKWNAKIADLSHGHSVDQNRRGSMDHNGFEARVKKFPQGYRNPSENVASNTGYPKDQQAKVTVDGWINSEGHRRNIISDVTDCGIGVYHNKDTNQWYYTQMFAGY